ncbi:LACT-domain-containing protein [Macrolepiota fuliginosa MF-IS2]|uniref:LACT-domain-containing protein n=1 Tax=Macrolepiota fuliginosa MF-IS2 TaxID=1400762 RepID=A0A9P5XNC6_9AGAR|nr:LACT-domain-containing protein [Macrolepiota fuliginosa MF-IS2]
MALTKRNKALRACQSDDDVVSGTSSAINGTLQKVKDEIRKGAETIREAKKTAQRPWWKTGRFLFPLGMLVGTLLGFAFVEPQDLQDMHAQVSILMTEYGVNLPELPDFDFSRVEAEWKRLRNSIPEVWKFNNDGREFQVGEDMKARGLDAKYPVILIPGIISTGLESWSTSPDYRAFFREKLWGGFNMISQVTFNKEKWIAAMMLDPVTGLDPPDVKIRAAEGIDAASTFIQGYWIWSKIVENLAVVNYDTNNLHLAPYDWRLSLYNLEERDGYFSKLKSTIELFKRREKRKVVIAAHSMGATAFKWVEAPEYGGGGPSWVENHVEAYIPIAGPHLGVPKAIAAFLSGEMKDTVQMNPAGAYVLERFFSRKERQKLFHSWAGSASMWIKGGNAVWGSGVHAPDDECNASHSHGQLIAFRQPQTGSENGESSRNMTADEASEWILEHTPSAFQKMIATNYSFGIERDERKLKNNNRDHTKWSNPLEVQLPRAPSMKIYCVYGVGKETERSYWYARGEYEHDDTFADNASLECHDPSVDECTSPRAGALNLPLARKSRIDAEYSSDESIPKVQNGVKLGEGDGTVSLISLGAMCVEGWKRKRWNPAGIKVTTVELLHRPNPIIPRGGANTSDHVDILGSTGLNEIILQVATGVGDEIKDNYVSNIQEYAKKVRWDVDMD